MRNEENVQYTVTSLYASMIRLIFYYRIVTALMSLVFVALPLKKVMLRTTVKLQAVSVEAKYVCSFRQCTILKACNYTTTVVYEK
jgi:hypothetical protein